MVIFGSWRPFLCLKACFLLPWTPGSFGTLRFLCNIVAHYRLLKIGVVFSSTCLFLFLCNIVVHYLSLNINCCRFLFNVVIFGAWRPFLHLKACFLLPWTLGSFGTLRFLCKIVVHYWPLNSVVTLSSTW